MPTWDVFMKINPEGGVAVPRIVADTKEDAIRIATDQVGGELVSVIPVAHQIRWFVWAGGVKISRTATMRGQWDYDVECSCGWKTQTGGATKSYIQGEIWLHKFSSKVDA